jgi:hypothetical protein
MPALQNPRWEKFCQALVASLSDKAEGKNTFKAAYIAAGYSARGHSAEELGSRLLRKVEPIAQRIKEIQAQQVARIQPKLDVSKERIGRRLHMASEMAEQDRNPHAVVASELGLAKVFGDLNGEPQHDAVDFKQARTMTDIGRKLLQSCGLNEPDDASIAAAVALNDTFVAGLERIVEQASVRRLSPSPGKSTALHRPADRSDVGG